MSMWEQWTILTGRWKGCVGRERERSTSRVSGVQSVYLLIEGCCCSEWFIIGEEARPVEIVQALAILDMGEPGARRLIVRGEEVLPLEEGDDAAAEGR